ncbi:LuxR C-terminal-related transcriptional regulator [uncultured Roseobacter sp.]|uniref:LuxR C-terminal-related transcriptional regulator n=1 Tax=uncultured Roseobacter sp. TaxID=114847 RepID=UPI002626CCF1|nr:LuxR C-terminal-related transcriptional regulator [uncultured Roseobacter sp.]
MTETPDDTSTLSTRENLGYAQGESYQRIADRLCLAPSTVRTHLATIYCKLGVSSKSELRDRLVLVATTLADLTFEHPVQPEKPSIAVLAFENMSGDREQAYFSDGISDDIITALSRSPWLFIIARNTTFT